MAELKSLPGYPAHGEPTYLDGAQLEVLTRIIVDDRNKIIAQVPFLVTAVLVHILGGHQGGNVENSCRVGDTGLSAKTRHLMLGLMLGLRPRLRPLYVSKFPCFFQHLFVPLPELETGQPRAVHTLHNVIMPAVGELAVLTTHI